MHLLLCWQLGEDRCRPSSCWFLPFHPKSADVTLVIFRVTGPIFANFAGDVATILPINIFRIRTAIFQSVLECQPAEWKSFCQFRQKLESEKEVQVDHLQWHIYYLVKNVKIDLVDREVIDLWAIFKKERNVVRSASLPSGLKKVTIYPTHCPTHTTILVFQ